RTQSVDRSVALAQGDHFIPLTHTRKHFAKTPYTTTVDWRLGGATLTPGFFQVGRPELCGVDGRVGALPHRVENLQEIATCRTPEVLASSVLFCAARNAAHPGRAGFEFWIDGERSGCLFCHGPGITCHEGSCRPFSSSRREAD